MPSIQLPSLSELWLEQRPSSSNIVQFPGGATGQDEVDAEFATTVGGALFLHSNFGALPIV